MTLTPHMQEILAIVLAESRRLEAVEDRPPADMDRDRWRELYRRRQEYQAYGVRHDLAQWLGRPVSPSDSAVFSRALRNMEAMGLVVRINCWGGNKTTHVRLTTDGRDLAQQLAKQQEESLAAMLEGLTIELPLAPSDDAPSGA